MTGSQKLINGREPQIINAYEAGATYRELEQRFELPRWIIGRVVRRAPNYGTRPKSNKPLEPDARALQMGEMRKTMKLIEIGDHYGITRERVRQILRKWDLDRSKEEMYRTPCRFCGAIITGGKLKEHVFEEHRHARSMGNRTMLTPELELVHEAIVEMYVGGERMEDISRTFRTSTGTPMTYSAIYRILRRYDIRPNRGAGKYLRTDAIRAKMAASQRRRYTGPPFPVRRGWRAND